MTVKRRRSGRGAAVDPRRDLVVAELLEPRRGDDRGGQRRVPAAGDELLLGRERDGDAVGAGEAELDAAARPGLRRVAQGDAEAEPAALRHGVRPRGREANLDRRGRPRRGAPGVVGRAALRDDAIARVAGRHLEGLRPRRRGRGPQRAGVRRAVGRPSDRPRERHEHRRGRLARLACEPDLDPPHLVGGRRDLLASGGLADLPAHLGKPRSRRRGLGERGIAAAQRLVRRPQVGHRVPRDAQRQRAFDLRRDVVRVQHRHRRQRGRRRAGRGERLPAQPGRGAREQQQHDVQRGRHEQRAARERPAGDDVAHRGAEPIARGARRRQEVLEQRARRTRDRQRAEQPDLRAELRLLRGDEQGAEQSDAHGERDPRDASAGDRLRVGDHEEHEQQDLGRGHERRPERPARDRSEVPARGHRVIGDRDHGQPGGERDPEPHRDAQQADPPEDHEAVEHDDRQPEGDPREHRPPPEVQRLRPRLAEDEEARDERDVGRVEDMPPAVADEVLGEDREDRHADVDPPAVQAPPVPVLRAGDAEDEGDAVRGQQRARRPHDHAAPAELERHVEQRARQPGSGGSARSRPGSPAPSARGTAATR